MGGHEVLAEVVSAAGIVHGPILARPVRIAAPVLGHVELGHAIVEVQAAEQAVEAVGIDLPVHLRARERSHIVRRDRKRLFLALGLHDFPRIVVDAQEIRGRGDGGHVAGLDKVEALRHEARLRKGGHHVGRIAAAVDRVRKPAVEVAIEPARGGQVSGAAGWRSPPTRS